MWGQFNVGDRYAKFRPPTTVRSDIDLMTLRGEAADVDDID